MKFKYSLEKVLKHREILESLAQRAFQEVMAELVSAENQLEALYAQEQKARGSLLSFQTGSQKDLPSAGAQLDQFLKLQAIRIEKQKEKILVAQKKVEEKRTLLRAAAIDRKILVKHKEQKKTAFMDEENRKDQAEMDELSVLRHERRNGDQEK